ncbi:MAG: hypothetical protein GPOALKHO_000960 [Sodalis sp.]|nr:MAG: hypothetical protein GPOALKHO_000960 [Sodalis sp.]
MVNAVRCTEALALLATGFEFRCRVAALIGLRDKDERKRFADDR